MKILKKGLTYLLLTLLVIGAIVAFRTLTAKSKQTNNVAMLPMPVLPEKAVEHLQKAIQCQTVSFGDSTQWKAEPFLQLRQLMESAYPLFHSQLKREIISDYSYLYTWTGKNPALAPYIFMAHQDVVPVEEATRKLWAADPFGGEVKNGIIYGRGAIDNKCNLVSMLESAEKLLQQGFQPERTIYFVFGHDEEIGGKKGAVPIAKLLAERGVKADLLIDEGGIMTNDKLSGIKNKKTVALVATAEKGYLTLEFSVSKKGGHSSMPENETAIDILMKAMTQLHDNPFPAHFDEATQGFIAHLGPEMQFPNNMAFTNQWLFKSMIIKGLDKKPTTRAMIHTTSVTTILNAGVKENVVPTMATAVANFRLLPGDSALKVVERVKEIIHDDRVTIQIKNGTFTEGSKAASTDGIGFKKINQIVKQTFDNVVTTPFLLIGATDSRYFSAVSDNIIKFSPVIDPVGFHTHDEQVTLDSYQHSVWFFEQLMRDAK
jgi:carboxypeptidase PM20D1